MPKKLGIILEVLLLLVVPVSLFTFRLLPPFWRYSVMELALIIIVYLSYRRRIGWAALGFRTDNFAHAVKHLLPGTMAIVGGLFVGYSLLGRTSMWWDTNFFIYYWLIGVFSQQFAFQGYLSRRLQQVTDNKVTIIVLVGLMFSFLHSYRLDLELTISTFFLGIYWAWVYLKQPNVYAVTLSHGIIGTVAIILGYV